MAKKGFADGYRTYDTSNGYGSAKQWRRTFSERMTGEEAEEILQEHARTKNETPYSILGIKEGASQQEIKRAFRELINFWHPDRNSNPNAEEMSKKIIAAYTKLKK